MENRYGYVRVSTREQNEERQMIALKEMHVPEENIYLDRQSGKNFNRPMYQHLLSKLKQDDILFIKSIDRLGRDYAEILEQWRILTKEECGYCCAGYASAGYEKREGSCGYISE